MFQKVCMLIYEYHKKRQCHFVISLHSFLTPNFQGIELCVIIDISITMWFKGFSLLNKHNLSTPNGSILLKTCV